MSLNETEPVRELNIRDFINIFWKRRVMIIAFMVAAAILSGVLSIFALPKEYQAVASIRVTPQNLSPAPLAEKVTIDDPFSNFTLLSKADYLKRINSSQVVTQVIDELHLNMTPAELMSSIRVSDVTGTDLVQVAVITFDPQTAERIADAVISIFAYLVKSERRDDLEESRSFISDKTDRLEDTLRDLGNRKKELLLEYDIEEVSLEIDRLKIQKNDADIRIEELRIQIRRDLMIVETLMDTFDWLEDVPASNVVIPFATSASPIRDRIVEYYEASDDTLNNVMIAAEYTEAQMRLVSASSEMAVLEEETQNMSVRIDEIEEVLVEKGEDYDDLLSSIALTRSRLNAYRQRKSEIDEFIDGVSGEGIIRTVSEATGSGVKVGPDVIKNVALAAVIGLVLGLATAYFVDVVWKRPEEKAAVSAESGNGDTKE